MINRNSLNLALTRRGTESNIESASFTVCQLSSLWSTTTPISCKDIALKCVLELGWKLPLLEQFLRKILLKASNNVFPNYWKKLERTKIKRMLMTAAKLNDWGHLLSTATSCDEEVLVFRMEVEDEIASGGIVVPANTNTLKAP